MHLARRVCFVILPFLGGAGALFAHDPGLSSADVEIGVSQISVTLTLNVRDGQIAGVADSAAAARDAVGVTLDGVAAAPESVSPVAADQNNNVSWRAVFPRPGAATRLVVQSRLLDGLPLGHREYLKIHQADGPVIAEQLLHGEKNACEVTLEASRVPPAALLAPAIPNFLLMGAQHVLAGFDHLLFLIGLLLVCVSFRQAVGVITCFTIAHSLTVALATLNILNISPRIVEPAIAASIVYVGIENILSRGKVRWRGALTFGFGLIHGLGFAGTLRAMGVGAGGYGVAVPLLSFNVGVELGQIGVAVMTLPVIFMLRREPAYSRIAVRVCSLLIAVAGGVWFIQRTLIG